MTAAPPLTRAESRREASSRRGHPLAPLAVPAFRLLWTAGLVSNVGTWMQTIGAQWQLVADGSSPGLVSLVQTASAAPVLLLALPAGVIGEFLNRRSVMVVTQAVQLVASLVLVTLSAARDLPASTLLTLTVLLGAAAAVQMPAAQSVISDVVPRAQVLDAASLSSVSVNVARAIGPAAAGIVIAQFGITAVFVANALSFIVYLAALLLWRNYRPPKTHPEPFLNATREGVRFVLRSSTVRALYARLLIFLIPANALWALLPVFAQRTLGLGADGYGMLLGVLGAGAVLGAGLVSQGRARWGTNAVLLVSMGLFGLSLCALIFTAQMWAILAALVAAGAGWIGVIATINAVVQASLPAEVRTRGLSIYQLVLYGGTAIGAAMSGGAATLIGTGAVLVTSGIVISCLTIVQAVVPFTPGDSSRRRVGREWPQDAGHGERETLVSVRYSVPDAHQHEFCALMQLVSTLRYKLGARSWALYEAPDNSGELLEIFTLPSWIEHVELARKGHDRTGAAALQRAAALCTTPPAAEHRLAATCPSSSITAPLHSDASDWTAPRPAAWVSV